MTKGANKSPDIIWATHNKKFILTEVKGGLSEKNAIDLFRNAITKFVDTADAIKDKVRDPKFRYEVVMAKSVTTENAHFKAFYSVAADGRVLDKLTNEYVKVGGELVYLYDWL